MLHHPVRLERKRELFCLAFLDNVGKWLQLEVVTLLVELCNDLPLLAGVVHDRDSLVACKARRYAELKLSFDLVGDGRQFVLVETNIGAIERLKDDVTRERSWLCGIAV